MLSEESSEGLISGATKGALDWASENGRILIKSLADKFRNRHIAFIGNKETIERAKQQRHNSEFSIFKQIMPDVKSRTLFQLGLTLRGLELDKQEENKAKLKEKIKDKYDFNGLHFAYFVENGLFGKYLGFIGVKVTTMEQLNKAISNLIENTDKYLSFITRDEDTEKKSQEIIAKIRANNPEFFIISSWFSANENCDKINQTVMSNITGYSVETYQNDSSSEESTKKIYFLKRKDIF